MGKTAMREQIREAEQASSSVVSGASLPAGIEANAISTCATPAFVPVQVSAASPERIHLELIKKDLTVRLDWPASQSQSCAQTLLVLAVSTVAVLGWWISARADRRRQRDMQLALQDNG